MKKMIRSLTVMALLCSVVVGYSPATIALAASGSGTIQPAGEEITLDFSVLGGRITKSTADGWKYKYFIEGTVRPGETLSIAVSGNGTSSSAYNEAQDATMSVWFDAGEGIENRENVTLAPGVSGSLASSFIVPGDAHEVEVIGIIGNTFVNPNGGGSRSLILSAVFEVEKVEVTTPPALVSEEDITPMRPQVNAEEKDCTENAIVRFGDLYGEVNVRPNSEDDDAYIFAELGTCLKHDDRIRTLPRSGAILSWSDMSTYVMKEDSIIVLDIANERETKIGLIAGNIWVNLKRLVKDGSMEVEMSQAVAGIKGTTLICEDDGITSTVKVIEGTVEVTPNRGEPVFISDGELVAATSSGVGPIQPFSIEDEMATWDETTQEMTDQAIKDSKHGFWTSTMTLGAALLAVIIAAVLVTKNKKQKVTVPSANVVSPVGQATPSNFEQASQTGSIFCGQCGKSIPGTAEFCGKCGTKV
ncbi:hypothetical protein AUK40_03950 [Candidatus Wirthbacteria bacterium CG2_30_54_11]|uniref:Uncharacterized protein n=1 Tax=Candidatus Wirthbacteria bacterium CG2_30_54_11 TaxID=1817892 RepID=A0A1J5IJ91_9BACT|nr:MAG: hypothetical protein AUK40_03950 [Candidatus Wirthbacteria bacterium CG2_30_54_11]